MEETEGRARQRQRTWRAIVDACGALIDAGESPTMEAVAERALVSRATIYRYFTHVDDIVWQVLNERFSSATVELIPESGDTLAERVAAAETAVDDYIYAMPDSVRRFELNALQRKLAGLATADDRRTRRLEFIDAALAPHLAELGPAVARRLRFALTLTIGPEALINLLDGCRLDVAEAREIHAWATAALVARALDEAGVTP